MGAADLVFILLTFLLGGLVKGVIGVGLPTVVLGVLSIAMTPAQAAALIIVPTLVTNIWQAAAGGRLIALARRLWTMLLGICVGTWLGAGILTADGGFALAALGGLLVLYAIVGLAQLRFSVAPHLEPWLSPVIGALTGVASAATGVFMLPAVPYMQALGLEKDDLVQAIGLSVTVSTIALAAILLRDGALQTTVAGLSLVALAPALGGMMLGQLVRNRVSPETFRRWFFVGLLLVGAHLALRTLL